MRIRWVSAENCLSQRLIWINFYFHVPSFPFLFFLILLSINFANVGSSKPFKSSACILRFIFQKFSNMELICYFIIIIFFIHLISLYVRDIINFCIFLSLLKIIQSHLYCFKISYATATTTNLNAMKDLSLRKNTSANFLKEYGMLTYSRIYLS